MKKGKRIRIEILVIAFALLLMAVCSTGISAAPDEIKDAANPLKSEMKNTVFESYNYPGYYIRHAYSLGELTRISSALDIKDSTFNVVPGLAGKDTLSFESANCPGYYLRHQDFRIKLQKKQQDQLYKMDATFKPVKGLADQSAVSFESFNYPGYYLRHRDFHLYLEPARDDLSKRDATFWPITRVSIDIEPGCRPNIINLKNDRDLLPVAILGSDELSVESIDPKSIKLCREGIGTPASPIKDKFIKLDGDCKLDLVVFFNIRDLAMKSNLKNGDAIIKLTLKGNLMKGTPIKRIVGEDCVEVLETYYKKGEPVGIEPSVNRIERTER